MTCYRPLEAWRDLSAQSESGKSVVVFQKPAGPSEFLQVPCGRCIGCRIEKSREWALRCLHEASLYEDNCFLTLTYDDEHLPEGGTLVKRDHQLFLKRLRRRYEIVTADVVRATGVLMKEPKFRYFLCGEYGDDMSRPHYHVLLFGFDFWDKVRWCMSEGNQIWRSPMLESETEYGEALWPHGFSWIGSVTWQSAAYVARYAMKKVNGDLAWERYGRDVDVETGECTMVEPEYIAMSRGGVAGHGIGYGWYAKFFADCQKGFLTTERGTKHDVPGYYFAQMEKRDSELFTTLKRQRKEMAKRQVVDRKRLAAKEKHCRLTTERLKRCL